MIWASTTNIALLYVFGMIPLLGVNPSFTITDFWRWWVVHLWVEQSFEFFAAAISAYLLMALGLEPRQLAERSVYLELILIFLGGVLGTGHHIYWVGGSRMWVPLGSMFSFIEVLPLVLLILDAMDYHDILPRQRQFRYGLAYTYILGSVFWNFVGAGVFGGGPLYAPLVNYYEHGTFLTLNHAHTALFGAFGLLAIGLIYFCLRYAAGERAPFNERLGLTASGSTMLGWSCGSHSISSRSAGRNSMRSMSMALPMRAVSNSATRPCCGNGFALRRRAHRDCGVADGVRLHREARTDVSEP